MFTFTEARLAAYFPGLVDVCQGEDGQLLYCTVQDGRLVFADQHITDTETCTIPERKHFSFTIPRAAEVERYFSQDDSTLYDDLLVYLKRFSALDDEQWVLVAYYVFLTYLHDHPDIDYCGYLLFYAVPERGKSRTGKSVSYVAFRGEHLIELREPIIFRATEYMHGTLFFDLLDVSKKAEQSRSEDILLLRAEKGVKCKRITNPDLGPFLDTTHYDIYGPTIIATNEPLHKILDTRCLPIIMPNRPGNYENPRPEFGLELKERLTAWRARHLTTRFINLQPIPGISGRLWDISKPLFMIATILKKQTVTLLAAVKAIAGEKSESRQETPEGRLVRIIQELTEDNGFDLRDEWSLSVSNIRGKFNEGRSEGHLASAQWIGLRLKSMSIRNRHVNGYSEIVLTQQEYRTLLDQYGLAGRESHQETQLSSNYPPEKTETEQAVLREVESSRESSNGQGGNHDDDLPF